MREPKVYVMLTLTPTITRLIDVGCAKLGIRRSAFISKLVVEAAAQRLSNPTTGIPYIELSPTA